MPSEMREVADGPAGPVKHDFDNALMALLGHVEILLDEVTADSPLREDLEAVDRIARRISGLVQQLLSATDR
jgi:signal transduction histidine kinase